jgi:dipeptidyl-peptidase 4
VDERGVGEMHLLEMQVGRPTLHSWPYALPGDSVVPLHEWAVIDVANRRVVPLQTPPDHQRTSSCCGRLRGDAIGDTEWSRDGAPSRSCPSPATTAMSRCASPTRRRARAHGAGGARRAVLRVERRRPRRAQLARAARPREVIWYSFRDGWGHLYLYDLQTGALKNRITSGEWTVVDVVHVDEAAAGSTSRPWAASAGGIPTTATSTASG